MNQVDVYSGYGFPNVATGTVLTASTRRRPLGLEDP